MGRRPRLRTLESELTQRHPRLDAPGALIASGEILVNGFPRTNPASLVNPTDTIAIRSDRSLRGSVKLAHALTSFGVNVAGRVALDLGAAAGGFTQVLLEAGAALVYAVDAGHGQLRGYLRQEPRVVNLERTNLGELTDTIIPEPVGPVTIDVSYLSIAATVPQLARLPLAPGADLIALVKPVYELGLATLPEDTRIVAAAVRHAREGLAAAAWPVVAEEPSPMRGTRGAVEWLLHAHRSR